MFWVENTRGKRCILSNTKGLTEYRSFNHRIVELGRDLWRPASTTPLFKAESARVLRAMSSQVLNTAKDADSTASLCNLFQCSLILTI